MAAIRPIMPAEMRSSRLMFAGSFSWMRVAIQFTCGRCSRMSRSRSSFASGHVAYALMRARLPGRAGVQSCGGHLRPPGCDCTQVEEFAPASLRHRQHALREQIKNAGQQTVVLGGMNIL